MTSVNGIKKRWIFNNLGFVVGIFAVLVVAFNFMIRGYFYTGIQQAILNRSKEVYTFFKGIPDNQFTFLFIINPWLPLFTAHVHGAKAQS